MTQTAIGIYGPRKRQEIDNLRHMTKGLGVDFTFQIGGYRVDDVPPTFPHVFYRDLDRAMDSLAGDLVAIEVDTHALPLDRFTHPVAGAYLIGPNTGTIPRAVLDQIGRIVVVPNVGTLNAATAAAIVLYDRAVTLSRKEAA